MLPSVNRLKKKKDFDLVFKKGKSLKTNLFIIKFIDNKIGLKRVGFIISSKVSKKSVVRNKLRRILSDIISSEMKKISNGLDIVIVALPGANKLSFLDIKLSINKSLHKMKLTSNI